MDIFKLKEITSREMTNQEKESVSNFMNNLVDNIRDTLKERKGREDKITRITETQSAKCHTGLGIKFEFVIERKFRSRVVVLELIPSTQKILFTSYDEKRLSENTFRSEFLLRIEGSRKSALKIFDLIDHESCFSEKNKAA